MPNNQELIDKIKASGINLKETVLTSDTLDGEAFDKANNILQELLQILHKNSSDDSVVIAVFEALGAMDIPVLYMRYVHLSITFAELTGKPSLIWLCLNDSISTEVTRRMTRYPKTTLSRFTK